MFVFIQEITHQKLPFMEVKTTCTYIYICLLNMLICGVASIVPLSVFDWHKKYIVYVVIIVRLSGYGLNVNVAIFLDTVNVKLCGSTI